MSVRLTFRCDCGAVGTLDGIEFMSKEPGDDVALPEPCACGKEAARVTSLCVSTHDEVQYKTKMEISDIARNTLLGMLHQRLADREEDEILNAEYLDG